VYAHSYIHIDVGVDAPGKRSRKGKKAPGCFVLTGRGMDVVLIVP
jgi:hypothetical protein